MFVQVSERERNVGGAAEGIFSRPMLARHVRNGLHTRRRFISAENQHNLAFRPVRGLAGSCVIALLSLGNVRSAAVERADDHRAKE
jgi:hypothetical protein